jgi:squalene-hopene/tetraprenyl-beta-curcumene cyclase
LAAIVAQVSQPLPNAEPLPVGASDQGAALSSVSDDELARVIADASGEMLDARKEDGHWLFDLEADATIPSEYVLLNHFLDEIDDEVEARLATYIRSRQGAHGGWPLFHGGEFDMSCTVKAYFALKMVGDNPEMEHMKRAREAVLAHGGAARCNVFTRTSLALFGEVPWRAVPSMPVEIMFLPRWFPFHLSKISYWSRTTLVPLLVLMTLRPRAKNPRRVNICELFVMPAGQERGYFQKKSGMARVFLGIDRLLKGYEKIMPMALRRRGIDEALAWCMARLNGDDGLGAIFPPMANLLMVLDSLGYPREHKTRKTVRRSIDLLLSEPDGASQYCQPCVSPIWDTSLAALAMMEVGEEAGGEGMRRTNEWMAARQITEFKGDWADMRPDAPPGGWAFQYNNDHYPDVDDTAVVAMALDRADREKYREPVRRAAAWIEAMQSSNGGWGSFDAENDKYYLNNIPFADHGALLDPPTVDVSARCIGFLAQLEYPENHPVMKKGLDYLLAEQEENGSWFGRWGTNYVYGTWSALVALAIAGVAAESPPVRKAVAWLESKQRDDGGWGETGESYYPARTEKSFTRLSTPSQTAWAVLALMAADETDSDAVKRGVNYLLGAGRSGPKWDEAEYTAVGFPRVFYLRYHGYSAYFPLWALARYRSLKDRNDRCQRFGM